jgi:hypothetical protein
MSFIGLAGWTFWLAAGLAGWFLLSFAVVFLFGRAFARLESVATLPTLPATPPARRGSMIQARSALRDVAEFEAARQRLPVLVVDEDAALRDLLRASFELDRVAVKTRRRRGVPRDA